MLRGGEHTNKDFHKYGGQKPLASSLASVARARTHGGPRIEMGATVREMKGVLLRRDQKMATQFLSNVTDSCFSYINGES